MSKIIYNGKEYKMGVNGNEIISFSSTTIRNNIKFGDNISTIFGKIMKFFNDLKSVAFSGSYNDLINKPNIPTKVSELTNDLGYKTTDKDTIYTHPTNSGNKHIPSGGSSGQILRWSADGTAVWGADNNTTYNKATATADGLMSKEDYNKIRNMENSLGGHVLRFTTSHYTGSTTMTKLLSDLSYPSLCITSTENITDKPSGKYGTIVIFKFSTSRASSICLCTDGAMYVNSWNASTSVVTGWKEK